MTKSSSPETSEDRHPLWFLGKLAKGEEGVVFMEFVIVAWAFFFLLFGIVQVGFMCLASMYVNHANYMAMRTYSAHYADLQAGFINDAELTEKYREAAISALGPIEHAFWKRRAAAYIPGFGENFFSYAEEYIDLAGRLSFDFAPDPSNPNILLGRTGYDYYLWVPYAGRIISGIVKYGTPDSKALDSQIFPYDVDTPATENPTFRIWSRNDLEPDGYHRMVLQQRWTYPLANSLNP